MIGHLPTVQHQKEMCYRGASHLTRLYMAVQDARDLGMTREEFRKLCERRPEHYAPVVYLQDCDEFWERRDG